MAKKIEEKQAAQAETTGHSSVIYVTESKQKPNLVFSKDSKTFGPPPERVTIGMMTIIFANPQKLTGRGVYTPHARMIVTSVPGFKFIQ